MYNLLFRICFEYYSYINLIPIFLANNLEYLDTVIEYIEFLSILFFHFLTNCLIYDHELKKIIALTFESVILLAISCEVIYDSACLYCSALVAGWSSWWQSGRFMSRENQSHPVWVLAWMALVPMGQRGLVTSASKEGKLEPANIRQELHGQRHDLKGRTEFTVNYTKLKGKNNVS